MRIKTNEKLFTKRKRNIKKQNPYIQKIPKQWENIMRDIVRKNRKNKDGKIVRKSRIFTEFNEEKSDFECFISFRKIQVLRKDKA